MAPTIFPTGVTIYDPAKCWNGYTIFQPREIGAVLIDMNGNVVNRWRGIQGLPGPNKILPGGYVMGSTGVRNPKFGFQDNLDLVQADWEGNIVWSFSRNELVKDPRRKKMWMARQHHDFQREGNPVGYYSPGMDPLTDRGNTIMVCHTNRTEHSISEKTILDDTIIEVSWAGEIVWKWTCSEHFDEIGFDEESRNVLSRDPGMLRTIGAGDWMHLNSASLLGPNRRFEAGDERFHPDNIIWSGRETNVLAVIDKRSGKITWKIGPDFSAGPELRRLGQIVGPHHVHMIPRGLPGEGNILVFDNGGWAGYGSPNPGSPSGRRNALRDSSRVIEFDPITLEVVWQYPERKGPGEFAAATGGLYSPLMSSAQRLANGNTLITEGNTGRIFEVTAGFETVWEYVNPYYGRKIKQNMIYRAYRVPYGWVPQAERSPEKPVRPVDNSRFRVPGSTQPAVLKVTDLKRPR